MKHIYCLLLSLCPYANYAQQHTTLTVGDTIAPVTIGNLYNETPGKATIPNREGKYVLLDFWATNCGSCIASFEKIQQLQATYKNRLQVLMVNSYAGDTRQKVLQRLKDRKQRTGRDFTLPYLLQDSLLVSYFPYTYLPHYVWISSSGRVDAITTSDEITEINMQEWLKGKPINLPLKEDTLRYDESGKPALVNDTVTAGILYRSLITASKKKLGTTTGSEATADGLITHFYLLNTSLLALYQFAFPGIFAVPYRQILYDSITIPEFFEQDAISKKTYCYEYTGRPMTFLQLRVVLKQSLEQSFSITAVAEYRSADCFVLSANDSIAKAISKGGRPATDMDSLSLKKYIRNQPVGELLAVLSGMLPYTLVDETGLQQNIDIHFPYSFYQYTLQQVKDFLRNYGLVLTETTRTLRMAVLKPMETIQTIDHQ
jgi:thiol-disulfide isomerase/thioredoxin